MNLKIIITSLLLFVLIVSYAQESRLSYGVAMDVGTSNESFYDPLKDYARTFKDYLPVYDEMAVGYELGTIVEYKLTDEFSLQSGLKYARYGFNTGKISYFNSHTHEFAGADYVRYEGAAFCLTLPLKVVYYRDVKKNKFFLVAGYSPSVNMDNNFTGTYYYTNGRTEVKLYELPNDNKKVNFVGEFGIGWEESVSENMSLFIYPNFKFQKIKKGSGFRNDRRIIFYGISLGLKIK